VPFSTRVSDDLDRRIRRIAAKHRLKIVEIIEQGIDLLEEKLKRK
jgi:predicted transcriptional regulator